MTAATLPTPQVVPSTNRSGPERVLQTLAAKHAATSESNAWKGRFQLARAIRGIEKGIAGWHA